MAVAIMLATPFVSCKEEKQTDTPNPDPLAEFQLIGEESFPTAGYTVQLYMMESPFVGYNQLAVRLSDPADGTVITNADIRFNPIMDMGTMMHSTPFEKPVYDAGMKAYLGSCTFIMPSSATAQWTFTVIGDIEGAIADTAHFQIEVQQSDPSRLYSFVSALDSASYFVALRYPQHPQVGLNDLALMVYRRQSMLDFPPATDLQIEIDMHMPSMGHGSPNNENPVHQGEGMYTGRMNCTMSGQWHLNLTIMSNSGAVHADGGYFELQVE